MRMDVIPAEIVMYMVSMSNSDRDFAYLQLDEKNCLIKCGGTLRQCGVPPLQLNKPVENQITQLSSLFPIKDDAIIIQNTQIKENSFIDIHMFRRGEYQWVLFFDNTGDAVRLQDEQQKRLSEDFSQESQDKRRKT